MRSITYIYHSSFLLKFPEYNILFDFPKETHIPSRGIDTLLNSLDKKPLFIFFSHSHEDHFNPNIEKIIRPVVDNYKIIISYDIYSNYTFDEKENIYVLEPEEETYIEDIKVITYESNDMGNAYLLFIDSFKLYYGGDLAEWIWTDTREEEKKFIEEYFNDILKELKEQKIDIGFSNFDPRLKNFAGGLKFLTTVKPKYFVPMHTFGKYEHFRELEKILNNINTKVFLYSNIGETFVIKNDD